MKTGNIQVTDMEYKLTCGLETHVELATKTKIFCGCTTAFGGAPNTHCCPVCTGQPGSLPIINKEVIRLAVRAGLALNCRINEKCHMDRKNYYYPDLPKAYQISQADEPVCSEGYVCLDSGKKIRIERIHIEEDAGKLLHEDGETCIDYNRAGVPLIEIVSEPDIETPAEAAEYAEKLQLILRYIGVSDCKMQEGSMRCDVNVSLYKAKNSSGEDALTEGLKDPARLSGTRTEIKNINSFTNIEKAVKCEMKRQMEILEKGEKVLRATLRYDAASDRVSIMRLKENSDDYRFFPEPDIPRFRIPGKLIKEAAAGLPELPQEKLDRYRKELCLSAEAAGQLYKHRKVCEFFEQVISGGVSAKNTANLIIKAIYSAFESEDEKERFHVSVKTEDMRELVGLLDKKLISFNRAAEILGEMTKSGRALSEFLNEADTAGVSDAELEKICAEAIENNKKAAEDIKNGKEKAINVLFGFVMKATRGKADTKKAAEIIKKLLL